MKPRVSVITTVYDRVDCLRRCVRSLQHSAFTDFEQIVVSDHPPDEHAREIAAICAAAGVQHIDLPQRYNDWGISPATAGLAACHGDYVCFLSDDNAYLPTHFPPLVTALDADPGLGFVYSSCLYNGARELRFSPPIGAGIDLGQPLFRRSVIRELLNDSIPVRVFSWDWEMIRVLLEKGARWQHIDALTFVFRLQAYPSIAEALA